MHRDYRLCMELNKKLCINLSRQDDYTVYNNKRMEDQHFSFFEFVTLEEDRYNLLSNKSQKGFLVPEQYQLDYFFLLRMSPLHFDEQQLLDSLKKIPVILGAYKLRRSQVKVERKPRVLIIYCIV